MIGSSRMWRQWGCFALLGAVMAGCAQPNGKESDSRNPAPIPKAVIAKPSSMPRVCGNIKSIRAFDGSPDEHKRDTSVWSLREWSTDKSCAVGVVVYSYLPAGTAGDAFKKYNLETDYGDDWYASPDRLSVPAAMSPDSAEYLCLNRVDAQHCGQWIYWARYGGYLIELNLLSDGLKSNYVSEGEFRGLLLELDSRMRSIAVAAPVKST
ncbi:hypothetical protein G3I60_17140 [Streptomyces sp. SID13666]|uniref:hypothetical protein n=1 Tax=unclassified Streptomyces TaxID=2593676 RepID=UPI0013BF63F9|nr:MULTISPECIES: hypothetical protein [unclassified Streptomyces]NEA55821.1 hypothetical protein [Streptomyces sp. SID13666]NEA71287.1 hypothetical protein [Streptomyces sp. SID13588]